VKRTLGMVTDPMTGVPAQMAWDHRPLVDASRERRSHSASDRLPTSPSIPGIWLDDFRLACRTRGVNDDYFIIQYLPIYVGEHV